MQCCTPADCVNRPAHQSTRLDSRFLLAQGTLSSVDQVSFLEDEQDKFGRREEAVESDSKMR